MKVHSHIRPLIQQQGVALIFSLILLIVVTLIGVVAMQNTTLEEKMAGNLRDSGIAFQAAEAALRAGEAVIEQNRTNQIICMDPPNNGPPPQTPNLDQNGLLNPCDPTSPALWVWTMDEDATGFPTAPRLDPNPSNGDFWWNEQNPAWWNTAASRSTTPPAALDLVANQPRYVLEQHIYPAADPRATWLDRATPADGIVIRNDSNFRRVKRYHRVTARGVGGTNNAAQILQSSFYQMYYVAD